MRAKLAFVFLTALVLCPNLSYGSRSCVSLLKAKPHYKLVYRRGTSDTGTVYNSKNRLDYLIKDSQGEIIGDFFGLLDPQTDSYDFYFSIKESFRNSGISRKLLTMFFSKFPKNKPIKSSLIFTNLEIFLSELENSNDEWHSASETPFVRALSKFGYKLSHVDYRPEDEDFILSVTMLPLE